MYTKRPVVHMVNSVVDQPAVRLSAWLYLATLRLSSSVSSSQPGARAAALLVGAGNGGGGGGGRARGGEGAHALVLNPPHLPLYGTCCSLRCFSTVSDHPKPAATHSWQVRYAPNLEAAPAVWTPSASSSKAPGGAKTAAITVACSVYSCIGLVSTVGGRPTCTGSVVQCTVLLLYM